MRLWHQRCARSVVVVLLWLTPALAAAQGVSYIYDELGRLIAVSESAGETAVYTYDAVGNVLAIARWSTATVAVIHVTPGASAVGATVTISGTGFSPTPGLNTVSFNGTTAVVSAATSTSLVVTVPAGATNGPIQVTAPGGSAASSSPFTVVASSAPTITNVTPTVATVGTPVTIAGTGFDPLLQQNRTLFNLGFAVVTAGSASSLATAVPTSGNSGPLRVTTPWGSATAPADFFVVPAPYAASDVHVTGRMTVGGSLAVAIPTAGRIGLVVFDAAAGQRVNLKVQPGPSSTVTATHPNRSAFFSVPVGVFAAYSDPKVIFTTGTHALLVDPTGTATGTTTLTLYDVPPDLAGPIALSGPPVTGSLSVPGQNARYTFSGVTGQRASVKATMPVGILRLRNPDGSILASATTSVFGGFLEPAVLGVNGTYAVEVDPSGGNTGSVTVTAYDVPPDVTGTLTVGGPGVLVTLATPGQNGSFTFAGTASQTVTVRVTSNTMSTVTVKLFKPDGTQLATSTSLLNAFNLATQVLPVTGTYTVTVDPNGANTGSLTLSVTTP